jgi:hypothetical protein
MRIFFSVLFLFGNAVFASNNCENWFKKSSIAKGADCLLNCSAFEVDMGTFECHEECPTLCKEKSSTEAIFSLSGLYGLTPSERALAAKEPVKTLKAYKLSWEAESICRQLYFESRTNDESDACRHFVWAWILTRDLGSDFANQVLNAHEDDPRQPQIEKAMDLSNNRQGQLMEQSSKTPSNENEILQSFKNNIGKKNLIIIKSRPENRKW